MELQRHKSSSISSSAEGTAFFCFVGKLESLRPFWVQLAPEELEAKCNTAPVQAFPKPPQANGDGLHYLRLVQTPKREERRGSVNQENAGYNGSFAKVGPLVYGSCRIL